MKEGQVERIDNAAHMDVAIERFFPKVRLIGVRLPREESSFISYLERANTLMGNAFLDSDVFISYDAFRYVPDSNYLSYLWFPYELEGTEVLISANLLLVMNGLCDYVPETNVKKSFMNPWNRLCTTPRATGSEFGARMRILKPLLRLVSTQMRRSLLTERFQL